MTNQSSEPGVTAPRIRVENHHGSRSPTEAVVNFKQKDIEIMENGEEWISWLRSLERIVDLVLRGRKLEVDMEGKAQHGYSVMIRDVEEPDYNQSIVWGVPTFKWANHADDVYGLLERILKKLPGGSAVPKPTPQASTGGGRPVVPEPRHASIDMRGTRGPAHLPADIFTSPPIGTWYEWARWLHLAAGILHLTHAGRRLEVRIEDHIGRGSTLAIVDLTAPLGDEVVVWESTFLDPYEAKTIGSFIATQFERLKTRELLYKTINATIIAELRQPQPKDDASRKQRRAHFEYLQDAFPKRAGETWHSWFSRVQAELALSCAKPAGAQDVSEAPSQAASPLESDKNLLDEV